MANLQVKGVPEALHRRLRTYARKRNLTLGEVVLEAIERELARGEFRDRLLRRSLTNLEGRASELLREERDSRERESEA